MNYTMPNPSRRVAVRSRSRVEEPEADQLPTIPEVSRATNCFVTPPEVADRMVDYLECEPGHWVLEPSAGTGNLLRALPPCVNTWAIEKDPFLSDHVENRGYCCECSDFLEESSDDAFDAYDRIIMNPPFERGIHKKHLARALKFLKPGGILIALVPGNDDSGGELLEILPSGTFPNTQIETKIIKLTK